MGFKLSKGSHQRHKTCAGNRVIELQLEAIAALEAQKELTGSNEFVFIEPKQKRQLTGSAQIRKNI
ncbi:hypothetical protein [Pseudoalteromonas phenolica]|uniref:hypothetical protein n=1 Tax=Pseudoalteromonas phenolica TaxID=161398 RepID=UPI000FFEA0C9|nr:hypothetical protein [Pseudoalteromonas phenolica]